MTILEDAINMLRQHGLEPEIEDGGAHVKIEFESTLGNPCTLVILRQPSGQIAINRARLRYHLRRAIDDRP